MQFFKIIKRVLFLFVFICIVFISPKVSALDYSSRNSCSNYEVATISSNGNIGHIECYISYNDALNKMNSLNNDNVVVFGKVNGINRIVNAKYGIVDLSYSSSQLVYLYKNYYSNSAYTYVASYAGYGGVDAALEDVVEYNGGFSAKIMINGFEGYVKNGDYEIIPLSLVKSIAYYIVNENIRHMHTTNILSDNSFFGTTIGPKPDMVGEGNYYSFDTHYFYNDIKSMLDDYKSNSHNRSINKDNPYYNYYMYLSNHTRTNYSSSNIDEYIRNVLGYTRDVYGKSASNGTSRLYGSGTFFYYAQEKYGVNAILAMSLSKNETGNGRSNLAINKNNGFGLNAVDSNPIEAANYFASFPRSILDYAYSWITYGYAEATDWRYFGPMFGNKEIGMNVKYASDTYWAEKMANNYYSFDKVFGMQDYDYYQLGIVNGPTKAYLSYDSSKVVYTYPEYEDGVVVVGKINHNGIDYYEVMSDINRDNSGNEIDGDYNWDNTVYVKCSDITLINKPKYGIKKVSDVFEYNNKNYKYDLHDEGNVFTPQVGLSNKDTNYYYDSGLSSGTGQVLLNNRYVIIYATCYDEGGNIKSYLVTSDYMYQQKHWVDAKTINIVSSSYGIIDVSTNGNEYSWVNYNTEDESYSLISGLYTHAVFPILEEKQVGSNTWYKIPVDLLNSNNIYGYTLKEAPNVYINKYQTKEINNIPVIEAKDVEIYKNTSFDKMSGVRASDVEDGDITSKIVTSGDVNLEVEGEYKITYSVSDSNNSSVSKSVVVRVISGDYPKITFDNITIGLNEEFNVLDGVSSNDSEDGIINDKIEVIDNNVDVNNVGLYKVVYRVVDSNKNVTVKTREVNVVDMKPVIYANDINIVIDSEFDVYDGVSAKDYLDKDITDKIEVVDNDVDTKKIGEYKVIYKVVDDYKNEVVKAIKVEVCEKKKLEKLDGLFNLNYIKNIDNKLILEGYQTIKGIDNSKMADISYVVIFEEQDTFETFEFKAKRLIDKIPFKVYSSDGLNYDYSWFDLEVDVDDLPSGNYKLYSKAYTSDYYSISTIVNKALKHQETEFNSSKYLTINNNYDSSDGYIEFRVRDNKLYDKSGSYLYNLYGKYKKLEFIDNKLHISGNSYAYGLDLSNKNKIKRHIIFENQNNYEIYKFDLDTSDDTGKVILPVEDGFDKTYAWFDSSIDISNLDRGVYTIYLGVCSNICDYDKLTEKLGRSLDNVISTINDKNYKFSINYVKGNRIELTIS